MTLSCLIKYIDDVKLALFQAGFCHRPRVTDVNPTSFGRTFCCKAFEESSVSQTEVSKVLKCLNSWSENDFLQVRRMTQLKSLELVKYRKMNGPFTSISELLKVQGFGKKTINLVVKCILNHDLADVTLKKDNNFKYTISRIWIAPRFSSIKVSNALLASEYK